MRIVPGMTVRDLPDPPSNDRVIEAFSAPVLTLVPQPHLRESSWASMALNDVSVEVSASYCFFRHPADLADPLNYADDIEATLGYIEKALSDNQPDWFLDRLRDNRYPMLWETVRTTRLGVDPDRSLAERLAEHVNHVLINTVGHRTSWSDDGPPILDHEVTARHAQSGFSLIIDGVECDALIIDTDPDVIGWAVQLTTVAVTVAIDRDRAAMIDLVLERRKVAPGAPDGVGEN
ncbi:MAG: hypothetical protein V4531_00505 [Actinomycetota bacterium]